MFEEGLYFSAGSDMATFDTGFGKVGIEICYDFWYPELVRIHAIRGASLMLNVAACPHPGTYLFQLLARVRAVENVIWLGHVNMVGRQKDVIFGGGTCLVNPMTAEIMSSASIGEQAKEEAIGNEIDLDAINRRRIEFPILRDVRPELLQKLCEVARQRSFPALQE